MNGRPQKPSFLLTSGDEVFVSEVEDAEAHLNLTPADIPLDVVFEDDHLLVVNKPRGLASHPARTLREPSLVNALLGRVPLSAGSANYRPGIVHRLDKDTTGLIVVAKTDQAHWNLARQIAAKAADRRYFAVVLGRLDQDSFRIDAPIMRDRSNRIKMAVDAKGKPAVTHVRRIGRVPEGDVIMVALETGRTHQIRIHLRAIGHPVIGDPIYGSGRPLLPLQLHAAFLRFQHPVSGETMEFYAAPPADFVAGDVVKESEIRSLRSK